MLKSYVEQYAGFGLISSVLNGIAGNVRRAHCTVLIAQVGAVYVSRLSTALHASREERHVIVGITLFAVSVPILSSFIFIASAFGALTVRRWANDRADFAGEHRLCAVLLRHCRDPCRLLCVLAVDASLTRQPSSAAFSSRGSSGDSIAILCVALWRAAR